MLEDRTLLAVTLTNIPDYEIEGPGPITGGGADVHHDEVAGAINALAIDPSNPARIFIASTDGGIWRTDDADAVDDNGFLGLSPGHVHWFNLTDQYPSLSVESLAFLPGSSSVLYAGIGDNASGGDGGARTGILRTTDGGNTWQQMAQQWAAVLPGVNPVGFGATGGALAAGTYFLKYTFTNGALETTASTESPPFTVAAGNQPAATVPALPVGATGVNLYLTPAGGAPGTEAFYGSYGSGSQKKMNIAAPPGAAPPPAVATLLTPGTAPPTVGGLAGLNVIRLVPTGLNTDGTLATQVLVAATNSGVFLSQDGGQTWSDESDRPGSGLPPNGPASDLILATSQVGNTATLYAAIPGQGVFRATLATLAGLGSRFNLQLPLKWVATNNSGPANSLNGVPTPYSGPTNVAQTTRILLAAHDAADGDVLYTVIYQADSALQQQLGSNGNNFMYGLFRSTDQGQNWQSMGAPGDSDGPVDAGGQVRHGALTADPADPNVAYVSGDLRGGTHKNALNATVKNNPNGNVLRAVFNPGDGTTVYQSLVGYHYGDAVDGSPHADSRALAISGNNLYYTSDGGIYRLNNFRLAVIPSFFDPPEWVSLNGTIFITELYSIAYDTQNNVIIGGAQDNGVSIQTDEGGVEWETLTQGDGGYVQVRLNSDGSDDSVYYYETQNLGAFYRNEDDDADDAEKKNLGGLNPLPKSEVPAPFEAVFTTDSFGSEDRLILATNTLLWESTDGGDNWAALPGPAGANLGAGQASRLIYGGRSGGAEDYSIIYAAAGTGLFLRTADHLPLIKTGYAGASIKAIVTDPDEWKTIFVADSSGVIWYTPNVLTTPFINITNNLSGFSTDIRSLSVITSDTGSHVLLAGLGAAATDSSGQLLPGATGGIFQFLNQDPTDGKPRWMKFGRDLPNALVTDLRWAGTDDALFVGTFGRSAWAIHDIASKVGRPGILTITGDVASPQIDNVTLSLDPNNPLMLDVYQNGPNIVKSVPVATLSQIQVTEASGADTLTVDFRNGVFNPPGGIIFDGGDITGNAVPGASLVVYDFDPTVRLPRVVYDAAGPGTGVIHPDGVLIAFKNLAPVFVNNTSTFSLVTPNSGSNLVLDTPGPGQARISGTSGGVGFENATVSTTSHVTLDLATHDTASENDTLTATAAAFLALPNTDYLLKTGPNVAGNVFNLDAQGHDVFITQNTIQIAGALPLTFDTLGTINLNNAANITVNGAATGDTLVVNATGTSAGNLRLNLGPLVVFNTLSSLHFAGNAGGDALTVHNPAGSLFTPPGAVQFDSGDPNGVLTVDSGGGASFTDTFNAGPQARTGNLVFAGPVGVTYTFTGVAFIRDAVPVGTLTVNGTDGSNTVHLIDSPLANSDRIAIDDFPVIDFRLKTHLVFDGAASATDQADIIYVNYLTLATALAAATIRGGAGDDVIRVFNSPSAVATTLAGDDANDLVAVRSDLTNAFTILGGAGDDTVYGGAGDDLIDGGAGSNILRAQGGNAIIDSNGNDLIYTGDGRVTVNGGAGSETVYGGAGNDLINGDQGFNLIHAGDGNTTVNGGPSGNLIFAGLGSDTLSGGAGPDTIYGGPGLNQINGLGGDDQLYAGTGRSSVVGGDGNDTIFGGPAANLLDGGAGDNTVVAGSGPETLQAADGDNYFLGGPLTASMTVGDGRNVLVAGNGSGGTIQAGAGLNVIIGPAGGGATITVQGSSRIWGRGGHNTLNGGAGDDIIDAGPGGNNVVKGNGGTDILFGRDASDVVTGDSGSYTYVNSTLPNPLPVYAPVTSALPAGTTLPAGVDYRGRWSEFASSASGTGLSGLAGFSIEPSVAAGPGGQYVAWADQRSGTFAIYVARHTAAGWQELAGSAHGFGISGSSGSARRPSIALDASGNPVVAWTQFTGTASDIEAARFDPAANGGVGAWLALGASLSPGGISATGAASSPVIVNTAAGPVIAWLDSSSGTPNVFVEQFAGGSWVPLGAGAASGMGVSGAAGGVADLALATDGTKVAVAWSQLVGGILQVYVKEYSGGTWQQLAGSASGNGVSNSATDGRAPTLAYQGGSLFAAWQDDASNYWEIYAVRYNGSAWVPAGDGAASAGGVSNTLGSATQPKLTSAAGRLYLLWADDRIQSLTGNTISLYAKKWDGTQFVEELPGDASGPGVSDTGGDPQQLAFTSDGSGHPFVAWSEDTGNGPQIAVRGNTYDIGTVITVNDGVSIPVLFNVRTLHPGDVIIVNHGTYTGFSVPAGSSGFLMVGAPGQVATIQGLTDLGHTSNVTVQGLNLAGGVTATGSTNLTLIDNTIAGLTLDGGTGAQVVHNTIVGTGLTLTGGTGGASVEHNAINGSTRGVFVTGGGATGLELRDNRIAGGSTGIDLSVAADGHVGGNDVSAGTIGLAIAVAFTGLIEKNSLHGAQTGIAYSAAAALSNNRVYGNTTGVTSTVADSTNGLGFFGTTLPNQIYGNGPGVRLTAASMQNQHIYGNATGVAGSGTLVSSDLDHANLIEGNGVGVDFSGPIEFNRIAGNTIGIRAHSGQLIAHNLIYRNTQTALSIQGQTDVRVFQNSFYTATGDLIRVEKSSSDVEVRNNILWNAFGYDLYIANDSQSGFFSDFNDLHASGTGKLVFWEIDFTDILDWQEDVHQFDLHSIGRTVVNPTWSEPRFYSVAQSDYRVFDLAALLRLSSPTIDASDPLSDQGVPALEVNLLANPGFESGLSGWTPNPSGATQGANPAPWEGSSYFTGGTNADTTISQTIDLLAAGFTAAQLDSQDYVASFGGRVRSRAETPVDTGAITLTFLDGSGVEISHVTELAQNVSDRWELVGGRLTLPVGTRNLTYVFEAVRKSGATSDSFLDGAFVHLLPSTYAPDLGARGNTPLESQQSTSTHVALRFPDLYTDWEKQVTHTIRWDTYNNTSHDLVRIDLYQDGANGPQFLTNITPGTPDTGRYDWMPGTSGIDYGTRGLRIQLTLVNDPAVFDRATESFAIPENTNTFFVNDAAVNAGDLTAAAGSNRNTGKLASSPMPYPNNVLRIYAVGANQTLTIDSGNYALLYPLVISNTSGVGDDEGFTFTGPATPTAPAVLHPANPLTLAPVVEVTGDDFLTMRNLTMAQGQVGLLVHGGSTHFAGSYLTVRNNTQDGLRLDGGATSDGLDHLAAFNNGGNGIAVTGAITALTDSTVTSNVASGISVTDAGAIPIEANIVSGNGGYGLIVTNSVSGTTTLGGNTDLTKARGNIVHDNFRSGIVVTGGVLVAGNTVYGQGNAKESGIVLNGGEARANVVHDNYDGITAGGLVDDNRVYHNIDAGIVANGGITVQGNVVYSNAVGVQGFLGDNRFLNNLVYANTTLAFGVHGGTGTQLVNNTAYQLTGDAVVIDKLAAVLVRDNILWTQAGYDLSVANDSQQGFVSDFNDLYTSGGNIGFWQSTARVTFSAWQGAAFTDQNSLSQNPLFVSPVGADGVLGYSDASHDGRDDDFHEQSLYGSFHGGALAPVLSTTTGLPIFAAATLTTDTSQSPAIDRGGDGDTFVSEPAPNGGFVNLGAYGNTAQASESPADYVLVLRPSGGETWPQGNTFPIRWRSQDTLGQVEIDLLGPQDPTPVLTIAASAPNTGTYSWTVPATLAAPASYRVRITRLDGSMTAGTSPAPFSIAPPVKVYYVNDGTVNPGDWTTATGDDNNDGITPDTPKASIQAVLNSYHPGYGDIIRVDAGTYNLSSSVQIPAADSGVTIVGYNDPAYANRRAVLDRGNQGSSIYTIALTGGNDVTLDHLAVTGGQAGIGANDTGSQRLTVSNSEVYGNGSFGIYLFGPSGQIQGATITGNRLHDNNQTSAGDGLYAQYVGAVTATDNIVYNQSYGIYIIASGRAGATITHNTAYGNVDGVLAYGAGTVVSGNTAYNNTSSGIVLGDAALAVNNTVYGQTGNQASGISMSGGESRQNVVFDNFYGIIGSGLVDNNRVFHNSAFGIVVSGDGTVSGNTVYANPYGIVGQSAYVGPYILNNLVYASTVAGITIHNAGSPVTNNTVYQAAGDALVVDQASRNIQVENNILWAVTGHDLVVAPDSENGFVSDYNDLVVANGNFMGRWESRDFTNRVDWFYELGLDQHSTTADPQFVNPAGLDGALGYSTATTGPATILEDTPGPNFSLSGAWTMTAGGSGGTYHASNGGNLDVATWTEGGLVPGTNYELSLTWPANNFASGSAVRVYDGNALLMTLTLDQRPAPSDFSDAGVGWKRLGIFHATSGTFTVTITHTPSYTANVIADALRVQAVVGDGGQDDNFHVIGNSPAIDAGDPLAAYNLEPAPNGGRINQGFDGDTAGATASLIQFVQPISPAGLEKFRIGQAVPVTWRTVGLSGSDTVNIDLLRDGDPHFVQPLADHVPDRGSFTWTIPADQPLVNDYRIRVRANDGIRPQATTPETFIVANHGHDYYVNDGATTGDVFTTAAGSNANSGTTPDQPVISLSALLTAYTFGPGDVIHVDTGIYHLGRNVRLLASASGVTIVGPSTAQALFDRGNQSYGANAFSLEGATDVTLDHLAITGAAIGITALDTGSRRLTFSNNEIFGNGTGGIQTFGYSVSYVTISGNQVHDNNPVYGGGYGINVADSGFDDVSNNVVYNNVHYGLSIYTVTYPLGPDTVSGNVSHNNNGHGIDASGNGTVVSDNVTYANIGAGLAIGVGTLAIHNTTYGQNSGTSSEGILLKGGEARENTVFDNYNGIVQDGGTSRGNRVYHNRNAGIVAGGYNSNTVEGNVVYSNDQGIQANNTSPGPYVRNNLVYANATLGIGLHSGINALVTNNTVYQLTGDALQIDGASVNNQVENNILWAQAGHDIVVAMNNSETNLLSDYNDLYASDTGKLGHWEDADFTSRPDWFWKVGLDQHSIAADPQFNNPAGPDGVLGYSTTSTGPATIIDDDSAAVSYSGTWVTKADGYGGSHHESNGDVAVAAYTITGLTPGTTYQLAATWPANGFASNAAYAVYDGTDLLTSFVIDQRPAPTDFSDAGASWKVLGNFYSTSGTFKVTLTHSSVFDSNKIADALRIQAIAGDTGADDDFHVKATSPTIDAGDPTSPFANEPAPNGGRVNLGSYGNTAGATTSPSQFVQILTPVAQDKYQVKQTVPVNWRTIGVVGAGGSVNIDLVQGDGTPMLNIASNAPDNGSFAWTIPTTLTPGNVYRVRVSVNDGTGTEALSDTFLVANNGHDYYVNDGSTAGDVFTSAVGNNANSGKTPDQPVADLRVLLTAYTFRAGDVIHVDTGSYRDYRILVFTTQDSFVTVQGPSTATALLNRGNQSTGSDVIDLVNASHVTLDHLSITGGVNGVAAYSTATSSYITVSNDDINGNSSYAVFIDSPNDHALVTASRVHDNSTRGYGTANLPAVTVNSADSVINGNLVFGNYSGIQASYRGGEADRVVVNNNVVRDNQVTGILGGSDVLVTSNTVFNNVNGIYLRNDTQRDAGMATHNVVYNNAEGFLTDNNSSTYAMTIASNRVYHNSIDGIHLYGSMRAIGNQVYSNPVGIWADTYSAPFGGVLANNIVYANTNQAILLNGARGAQVDNNDLYQPVGDAIRLQAGAINNRLHNNIAWVLGGYDAYVSPDSQSGLVSDYNLFNKGPAANAHVGFWGNAAQDTFAAWQTASGVDAHGLSADPGFVDLDGADNVLGYTTANGGYDGGTDDNFFLSRNSAAIDRGYSWPAQSADSLSVPRKDDPGVVNAGSTEYVETQLGSSQFTTTGTAQHFFAGQSGSYFTLNLPFAFPFYDGSYSSVTVSSRGFVKFAGPLDPTDGANADAKLFASRIIAPFWASLRTNGTGNDIFVDTTVANQVTVRWNATGVADGSPVNVSAILFKDGRIRFDYGAGNANQSPTIGISFGNGQIYRVSAYDGRQDLANASSVEFDFQTGIVDIGASEFRVSSLQVTPPTVAGTSPTVVGGGGSTGDPISQLQVSYSGEVNPIDASAAAVYELRKAGSAGFGSPDDVLYTVTPQYTAAGSVASLAINGLAGGGLPVGTYKFTIFSSPSASIHDLAGLMLDGDADGIPGGDYTRTFTIVPPQADVAVTVALDNAQPIEGGTVHYTLTLGDNAGPQAASGMQVTDLLPAGLTLVTATPAAGTTYDPLTGLWSVGSLAIGGSATLVLTATVNSNTLGQTITNSATITAAGQADPNSTNNTAATDLIVQPSADLAVGQTLDDLKPIEGEVVHYTVTVRNQTGPGPASGIAVTDVLPAGVTFLSATSGAGTFDGGTEVWSLGSLAVGGSATLVIAATVNAKTLGTLLTNAASITAAAQGDPNSANNTSTLSARVRPGADLNIIQTVDKVTPAAGTRVQFTITVDNLAGPDDANDVTIDEILPDGLRLVGFAATLGQFTPGGGEGADADAGTPEWYLQNLPAGATATLTVTVIPDADTVGQTLTNSVLVDKLNEIDLNPDNNFSTLSITVSADAVAPITVGSLSGTQGTTGWYTGPVTVSLTASDNDSGVAATSYSLDGGNTWLSYSAPFVINAQGTSTVEFYSVDNAGNTESIQSDTFKIDGVKPSTTDSLSGTQGSNGWYTSASVGVTLTAGDATSGVAATFYTLDGGSPQTYSGGAFVVSGDGMHTIVYYSVDSAGNEENANKRVIPIDSTPPVLMLPADQVFAATQSDGAVVTYVGASATDNLTTPSLTYSQAAGTLFPLGVTTVYVGAIDAAGNEAHGSFTVTVNKALADHLRINAPTQVFAGGGFTVTVDALDPSDDMDPQYNGSVALSLAGPAGKGKLSGVLIAPVVNGLATFNNLTLHAAGTYTLLAASNTDLIADSASLAVVVPTSQPTTATHLAIVADAKPASPGQTVTFTLTPLDRKNRPAAFQDVLRFASSDRFAILPDATPFAAGPNGAMTFTVVFNTPGKQTVTIADMARRTLTATGRVAVGAIATTHLGVTSNPTTALSAGSQLTVTVTGLTATGSIDPGFADELHLTTTDTRASITAQPIVNGVATFSVTLYTAGRQTIRVTDVTRPALKGPNLFRTVMPAAAAQLAVTHFPSTILAGVAHRFTVTALDQYGNPITSGFADTVSVAGTTYTFKPADRGAHVFSTALLAPGTASVTATDVTPGSTVTAGSATNIAVIDSSLAVNINPPAFDLAGQPTGAPGQPLPFTLLAGQSGIPAATVFTYKIDWNGKGRTLQTISGPGGLTVNHIYPAPGTYTIKLMVIDAAGDVLQHATMPVVINSLALEADPDGSGNTALVIGGPASGSTIILAPSAGAVPVAVSINGAAQKIPALPSTLGHIIVYGQGGNDTIKESGSLAVPAILFGGGGTNVVSVAGSTADNILVGGPGKNTLTGGNRRDILIGGGGAATLYAGSDGDILIGGSTTYNANMTALVALMAEWASGAAYQQRVRDLFGDGLGGLNGSYKLNPQTVTRHTAISQLFGGPGGLDWFWFCDALKSLDNVNGYSAGEVATFEA
jgi:uncharacterized repeat protein (TIGR01451 family)